MKGIFIIISTLLLTGCVTNIKDCDPTTGDVSIITKFNCNYSGAWDQRVADKKQTLQHEQALNKEFLAVYAAIAEEKAQSNASVASKRQKQQALQRSMTTLLTQLKQKNAGHAEAQKQIAELEKSMKEAQNRPSTSEMQKQMELQKLQDQLASLQEMLASQ
ncbi:hypothetical protein [Mixta intestinalis]|uniref:Lipoprotein n=1 Tax=Mixta intestinalis TaxID=1615494 RepID=A0A6P1PZ28_9GAMM|nr:hypothetical protein [Mixta intestinalis]QHM71890.1 hypothetical protein C7M51_02183 [Mixta intestinalis]